MDRSKISNRRLAFYIAFVYVVLATIYCYWAMDNLISDGFLYYLFSPAAFFPSLILFTEREPGLMILICQIITFLILWPMTWLFTFLIRGQNSNVSPKQN